MPKYLYTVKKVGGETVQVEADTIKEVAEKLRKKLDAVIFVTKVKLT